MIREEALAEIIRPVEYSNVARLCLRLALDENTKSQKVTASRVESSLAVMIFGFSRRHTHIYPFPIVFDSIFNIFTISGLLRIFINC